MQTMDDVKKSTVKIVGDGQFCGTGFFYKRGYCITCHHVIWTLDKIQVEHENQTYDAEWSQDYSSMDFDIAVLKINGLDLPPLRCAKETTPSLPVSAWGYTSASVGKFQVGKVFSGELETTKTWYTSESAQTNLQNPWNLRPAIKVEAYQLSSKTAGPGLSGAPIFEPNRGKIVGMFVGILAVDAGPDISNEGYVIPIELIIDYKKPNIYVDSTEINVKSHLDDGNRFFESKKFFQAIEQYALITNNENYNNAWFNMGKAYLSQNQTRLALQCFEIHQNILKFITKQHENKSLLGKVLEGN